MSKRQLSPQSPSRGKPEGTARPAQGPPAAGGPGSLGSGRQPRVPPLSPPSVRRPSPVPGPRSPRGTSPPPDGALRLPQEDLRLALLGAQAEQPPPGRLLRRLLAFRGRLHRTRVGRDPETSGETDRKGRRRPAALPAASGPQRLRRAATGRAGPLASSRVPPRAEPGTGRPPRPLSTDSARPSADPGGGASGVRAPRLAGGGSQRAPRLERSPSGHRERARERGGACADARLRARAPCCVLAGTTVSSRISEAAAARCVFRRSRAGTAPRRGFGKPRWKGAGAREVGNSRRFPGEGRSRVHT